jgi:hypothetical protein
MEASCSVREVAWQAHIPSCARNINALSCVKAIPYNLKIALCSFLDVILEDKK